MLFLIALLSFPGVSKCDYECLCSYDVEKPVHDKPSASGQEIGYLYEFDCKPTMKNDKTTDRKWAAIAFENKVGYVELDQQIEVVTCPGDPSVLDIVTDPTLSPTTVSSLQTPASGLPSSVSPTLTLPIAPSSVQSRVTSPPLTFSSTITSTNISSIPISSSTLAALSSVITKLLSTTSQTKSTSSNTESKTTSSTAQIASLSAMATSTLPTTKLSTGSVSLSPSTTEYTTRHTNSTLPITILPASNTTSTLLTTVSSTGATTSMPPTTSPSTRSTTSNLPTTVPLAGRTTSTITTKVPSTRRTTPMAPTTVSSTRPITSTPPTTMSSTRSTTLMLSTKVPSTGRTTSTLPTTVSSTSLKISKLPTTESSTSHITSTIPTIESSTRRATLNVDSTTTSTTINTATPTTTSAPAICPYGWLRHSGSCYLFHIDDRRSWFEASDLCTRHSSHLVHIETQEEDQYIAGQLKTLVDTHHGDIRSATWIGGVDEIVEGLWLWYGNNTRIGYTNWSPGQPDSGNQRKEEDCISIVGHQNWKWEDYDCQEKLFFVCERASAVPPSAAMTTIASSTAKMISKLPTIASSTSPSTSITSSTTSSTTTESTTPTTTSAPAICPYGWNKHNGSCYLFHKDDRRSWFEALDLCTRHNAHLVYIETREEDNYITTQLKTWVDTHHGDTKSATWIGGADDVIEGVWMWYGTETRIGYTNWKPGKPETGDKAKQEDCLCIVGHDNWKWDDYTCEKEMFFVCEKAPVRYNGPHLIG